MSSGRRRDVSTSPDDHPSPQAETLAHLIREETDIVTCGLIVSEVLQRAKSRTSIERHSREMDDYGQRSPTPIESAELFRRLRARGITIRSTIDCVFANLAAHHDALIILKDRDRTLIVESKLLMLRSMPV